MTRVLLLILVCLLLIGCGANWVRVDGVYTETLMNKRIVYYAKVNGGDREVSELLYDKLVDRLDNLPDDKVLELHGNMQWVKCLTCGRRVLLRRREFNRRLKKVVSRSWPGTAGDIERAGPAEGD